MWCRRFSCCQRREFVPHITAAVAVLTVFCISIVLLAQTWAVSPSTGSHASLLSKVVCREVAFNSTSTPLPPSPSPSPSTTVTLCSTNDSDTSRDPLSCPFALALFMFGLFSLVSGAVGTLCLAAFLGTDGVWTPMHVAFVSVAYALGAGKQLAALFIWSSACRNHWAPPMSDDCQLTASWWVLVVGTSLILLVEVAVALTVLFKEHCRSGRRCHLCTFLLYPCMSCVHVRSHSHSRSNSHSQSHARSRSRSPRR